VTRIGPWTILALAAACGAEGIPAPPAGFAHAVGTRECGPADGPAVAIYLAGEPVTALEPPAPYVRIFVWRPLNELPDREWTLAGQGAEGSAIYCRASDDCEVASSGSVRATDVAPDSTIAGSTDLTFPVAGRVSGGFRAVWLSRVVFCG